MPVTDPGRGAPTAALMRLDGGHPALDLVNTVWGQVGKAPEHDVLAVPEDLVTFARRVGMAPGSVPASAAALREARSLRAALDAALAALLDGREAPRAATTALERAVRRALRAARLSPNGGAVGWSWPADDPHAPVHRLALAAVALLGDEAELRRLHRCDGCCWVFLDHSRGTGRRWCSMAWCGTDAKKRRYVHRRRERRAA